MLLAVGMATLLGLAFRGNLRRFARPALSRNGLLGFGVLAQATALVARHPGVYAGWLAFGAAALVLYAARNRGRPGLLLAAGGLLLNVVAIVVNWGMPVDLDAAARAGVPSSRLDLATDPLRAPVTADTMLPWLGETIPLALPLRPAVASPGDLLAAAGAAAFVFTGLTGRGRPTPVASVEAGKKPRRRSQDDADGGGADGGGAEGWGGELAPDGDPARLPADAAMAAAHAAAGSDASRTDAPGTDAPGTEAAGTEAGGTEAPGTEAGGTEAAGKRKPSPDAVSARTPRSSAAIRSTPSRSAAISAPAADRGGTPEQRDRKAAKQARKAQRHVAGHPGSAGTQPDRTSPGATADQLARRREKKSKRQQRKATRSTSATGEESVPGTDPAAVSRRSEPRSSPAEDG